MQPKWDYLCLHVILHHVAMVLLLNNSFRSVKSPGSRSRIV